jgi:hypothetical protein
MSLFFIIYLVKIYTVYCYKLLQCILRLIIRGSPYEVRAVAPVQVWLGGANDTNNPALKAVDFAFNDTRSPQYRYYWVVRMIRIILH